MAPSRLVAPPRVAAAPVALECRVTQRVSSRRRRRAAANIVTFGQVVGVHVDERYIVDGRVDLTRLKPIARCGYRGDYTVVEAVRDAPTGLRLKPVRWPIRGPVLLG